MTEETFAAIVGGAVGSLVGVVAAVGVEKWRRCRDVKALRATLREHFLSAVGVIAQKRALLKTIIDGLNAGGTPEGFNLPFPIEALRRVDQALGEDLTVRERHVVANVISLFAVVEAGIAAGLSTSGNEVIPRLKAMSQVGVCPKALDNAEDLITRFLKNEVVDVTLRDQTAKDFPA